MSTDVKLVVKGTICFYFYEDIKIYFEKEILVFTIFNID